MNIKTIVAFTLAAVVCWKIYCLLVPPPTPEERRESDEAELKFLKEYHREH